MSDTNQHMNGHSMSVFINPRLLVQDGDFFTTGIVYMPIGLAYTVASLQNHGYSFKVIDAFGAAPRKSEYKSKYFYFGLNVTEVLDLIPDNSKYVFVYANQLSNHSSVVEIIAHIKTNMVNKIVIVLENTQAVTAYSLCDVAEQLFDAGADYLLSGESEARVIQLIDALNNDNKIALQKLDGLSWPGHIHQASSFNDNLDSLPFPAWEHFPLENYWKLKISHGPFTTHKYLPLLTSRGCPYPCRFCVIPATNLRKWRARSGQNVANEIDYMYQKYGVSEFHLEDLNPTINDARTRDISNSIIHKNIPITWKIVAGTKVESIRNEETVKIMARSGCNYVSMSPESGSKKLLRLINKPFSVSHAKMILSAMSKHNIKSQACFVLGFPGETKQDQKESLNLIKELVMSGLDEIAVFIISPVPGSEIFNDYTGYSTLSQLTFTPTWRADYVLLNKMRIRLYLGFLIWKMITNPQKIFRQCLNFVSRKFETKMEMVPYKAMKYYYYSKLEASLNKFMYF